MNISEVIRERIKQAGSRFHCNDNIADFIKDEDEIDQLVNEVADRFQGND
jgi:GTP cyclohydrolase I